MTAQELAKNMGLSLTRLSILTDRSRACIYNHVSSREPFTARMGEGEMVANRLMELIDEEESAEVDSIVRRSIERRQAVISFIKEFYGVEVKSYGK